ncbi:MAG: hypothetical protein V2I43_28745 [Parvularcula sp.]|jgi:hypothetical protein|nr:hypothetical protein [Parvularcula sp.]
MMAAVEIDFEVYKELTARRDTEDTTYNDVIRDLLGLEPKSDALGTPNDDVEGLELKGVFLPNGTLLRATYKGQTYSAEIENGAWIGSDGKQRNTPSEAACAITHNNVNGWRFWNAKRPNDARWRILGSLRSN